MLTNASTQAKHTPFFLFSHISRCVTAIIIDYYGIEFSRNRSVTIWCNNPTKNLRLESSIKINEEMASSSSKGTLCENLNADKGICNLFWSAFFKSALFVFKIVFRRLESMLHSSLFRELTSLVSKMNSSTLTDFQLETKSCWKRHSIPSKLFISS